MERRAEDKTQEWQLPSPLNWSVGLGAGVALGVVFGVLFDNIGVGIALGISVGMAFVFAFSEVHRRGRGDGGPADPPLR